MNSEKAIKAQLLRHLHGGEAFMPITQMLEKMPFEKVGAKPNGLTYSFYEIVYHITYAQQDILNFCTAETYELPDWPKDYWPDESASVDQKTWEELKSSFFDSRQILSHFIQHTETDLLNTVKHGTEQTALRELMLVIEHNAYHTGQLAVLMRLLDVL